MDDQGRFIIPAHLRKDGKAFVGETFKETKVLDEAERAPEGNRHERRSDAAIERKIERLQQQIAQIKSEGCDG